VRARYRYTLEPAGAGTAVRLTAEVGAAGPWALLAPLIRTAIRRADAGQLDALRDLVESART
jgi:hypothetical protein